MKVIIDCDPGIDDMLALMYALKSEDIEVLAVTTVGGNVSEGKGAKNVSKLMNFLGIDDIPILKGKSGFVWIDAKDTHGENGIGNYYMPVGDMQIYSNAIITMKKMIRDNPGEVTLVCLGPLTNVATVFEEDDLIDKVKEVVIMGGCYKYPGNCSPVTEFNFWSDPVSAKKLFEEFEYAKKLRVIGLEITHNFILTQTDIDLIEQKNPRVGEFVRGITSYYMDFHAIQEGLVGCVINDPVIIGALKFPSSITYEDYYVQICDEVSNHMVRGQMIVDRKNFYKRLPNAKVAICGTTSTIWSDFIDIITK